MHRTGSAGALLDIYEQVITDLKKTILHIPDGALTIIIDSQTADENCRSLQTILSHVVHSGFGYATSIFNFKRNNVTRKPKTFHTTFREYLEDLEDVFAYTLKVFKELRDEDLEQLENSLKIKAGWGQLYDIEQLMEHAIVHVLRHQRQIEKIKLHTFHLR